MELYEVYEDNCHLIPKEYIEVCCESRDFESPSIPIEIADQFVSWVKRKYKIGIHGDPISWNHYKLQKIDCNGF